VNGSDPPVAAVVVRVAPSVTHPKDEETDRAVSRRVDNPTSASESDERAYAAADAGPESDRGASADPGPGGTEDPTMQAAREVAEESGEPTRSE
jgi:hypothetical protein